MKEFDFGKGIQIHVSTNDKLPEGTMQFVSHEFVTKYLEMTKLSSLYGITPLEAERRIRKWVKEEKKAGRNHIITIKNIRWKGP